MQIAIASGKGGTGKTSLAVNLAAYLAFSNVSYPFKRIHLVDLDVEAPNGALFFKDFTSYKKLRRTRPVPKWDEQACTLCGECKDFCNFNALAFIGTKVLVYPELCHACYACTELCPENALPMQSHEMGDTIWYHSAADTKREFDFTESRLDIGQVSAIPIISQTIEDVQKAMQDEELVMYDAPPGTSCPMIEVVKNADLVILVTEPTPFGLHDLKLAHETVKKLNKPAVLVLNKAGMGEDEIIYEYAEQSGLKLVGKIPHDRKLAEKYSRGELYYEASDEVYEQFETIGTELMKELR